MTWSHSGSGSIFEGRKPDLRRKARVSIGWRVRQLREQDADLRSEHFLVAQRKALGLEKRARTRVRSLQMGCNDLGGGRKCRWDLLPQSTPSGQSRPAHEERLSRDWPHRVVCPACHDAGACVDPTPPDKSVPLAYSIVRTRNMSSGFRPERLLYVEC